MAEKKAGRNQGIHLARGLCAIGVAAYHYLSWEHGIAIESAGAFLVYVFFIISALTLMMAHSDDFASGIEFAGLVAFYRKRVARILPLLAGIALFAAILGSIRAGSWQIGTFARAYLTGSTLFGLQMPGLISNVVAAWSLGIEAVFYLVFPILALFARNVRLRTVVVATVMLVVAQQAAILLIRSEQSPIFWFRYANPLVFAPFFALGILIYLRPMREHPANFTLSMTLLLAIASFSLLTSADVYRNPAVYLLLTALAAGAVLTAYSASVPNWASAIGKVLGDISYALYLTHFFSYNASDFLAERMGMEGAQSMIFTAIALSVAYLLYRFFEVPTRRLLRGDGGDGRIDGERTNSA